MAEKHAQLDIKEVRHTALQDQSSDPLQGCLFFFIKYYRLNTTLTSVLSGLPLVNQRLTPELFGRAAGRAGLVSRVVRRQAIDINKHTLPAVVMLKSGRAAVLLARKPADKGRASDGGFEGEGQADLGGEAGKSGVRGGGEARGGDARGDASPAAQGKNGDGKGSAKAGSRARLEGHAADDVFVVMDTFTGDETTYVGEAAFDAAYGGYMILVRQTMTTEMGRDTRNPMKNWFWGTLRQFTPLYRKVLLAALVINVLALVTPLFTMNVYDRVVPNAAFETLWVLAIGVFVAYLFDFVFKQLRVYFVDTAGRGADILLGSRIYEQVLNARLGTATRQTSGGFANQLKDYENLRDFFTSGTVVALVDVPFMFLFFLVIGALGGWIVLIPMTAVPLVIAISWFVQRPIRALVTKVAWDSDTKHGHLIETINGLENIKALGSQSHAQGIWEKLTGVLATNNNKVKFISNLAVNFNGMVQSLVTVGVVIAGVYKITDGEMTMGSLIACSMLTGRALVPLSQISSLFARWQMSMQSLDALTKLMLSPLERPAGKKFVHVQDLSGHIRMDGVTFRYPGSQMDSLRDVSLTITPGEKVAIVGRAGSGKSTLSRLILNLYEPQAGSVMLDNLDVRQLDPAEIRRHVSYFPQNLYLFKGTLRENLLLANPAATDDLMLQAVEMSGAMRLIRRHPLGFDLPVGERGEMLSGGQRQAVGLARALMQQGSMVILDDPTSEMDLRSEDWVKDRLSKWLGNRTLILVTHRPAMLELVDRLIVMEEGRVLIDGPKEEVLRRLQGGTPRVAGEMTDA
ncbi:MAG: type I secretion system permease/ATPase [Alphaproteobacteria bacterium CG_4_10_14_0_8_um_filter_53_9]|nr:MAG: type I secretion system permease/ATPase [Alphaproteobacteria bacterium CG_4_10_14_0_8_um_filter_53_9]